MLDDYSDKCNRLLAINGHLPLNLLIQLDDSSSKLYFGVIYMFIEPMLLQKSEVPFNDEKYIVEWKNDGWRMIVSKWNGQVRLYSRHNNEFTFTFNDFTNIDIPDNTVLDCELIAVNEGKCDFELLQQEYRSKHRSIPLQLVVFDILFLEGEDLRKKPLLERKLLLDETITESDKLVISKYIDGSKAVEYFELIKQHDLEGIVMKEKNSIYESRRSEKWLKVLNLKYEQVYISGIRKGEFGVYLSFLDGRYAGMIEFMKKEDRKKVYNLISSLKIAEDEKQIRLDKKAIVEVKFRNKFRSGLLRIPQLSSWGV